MKSINKVFKTIILILFQKSPIFLIKKGLLHFLVNSFKKIKTTLTFKKKKIKAHYYFY